jgi:hypothetical protein
MNVRYIVSNLTHFAIFGAKKPVLVFENDSAFLVPVGFLKKPAFGDESWKHNNGTHFGACSTW